jgi:AraC-like DNA-binding protein
VSADRSASAWQKGERLAERIGSRRALLLLDGLAIRYRGRVHATVLAVASNAVLDACARLGLDRSALASAAGVSPGELADPDARLPAAKADAIWAAAVAASDDACLALHAAEAVPFGAYRVLDFLTANAPTLGDALERVAAYFPLIDPRARVGFERGDDSVALTFVSLDGLPLPAPAVEYTFAALLLRTRAGLNLDWRPRALELTSAPPPPKVAAELARVFAVAPRHAATRDRMLISARDWERANARGDRSLFEVLDRHAAMLLAELPLPGLSSLDSSLIAGVRAAVGAELRGGDPTLDRVAGRMAMSGRTLQRRLDEHSLRFGELVDEVRSALAKAYLQDRQMALCEVAFLLGFADQSAFGRAFKRWTGMTPGRWRRAA